MDPRASPPLWRSIRAATAADADPASVANVVLRALDIRSPPIPISDMAKRLGVRVVEVSNPGWLGAVDPTASPAVIWVDAASHRVRKRFTIAHELGHLLLHPLTRRFRDATFANPRDKAEVDANEFAASLLMPLWMVEPLLSDRNIGRRDLADQFFVADGAMNMQLAKLV